MRPNNLPEVTGTGVTGGGPAAPGCAVVPSNATHRISQRPNHMATPETDTLALLPLALLSEALTGHAKNLILRVPTSQSPLSLPSSREDIQRKPFARTTPIPHPARAKSLSAAF